ncbi:MAG: hypothetical protein J0M35_05840 [Candidatus Obscuribacter phosphatis]|uniref:precorrin-2 dehydrogenase n=1 Tax=Candidatus Obscuribacter phosphatis TaxID=1906157 RepID=A0A8J7P723_9BACT|nr:hypothetical protein [Candidatus Obscuribacter phosphatis]
MSNPGESRNSVPNRGQFLPIGLYCGGKEVLVLGAGKGAFPEIVKLLDGGASVTVVAPHASADLQSALLTHGERLRFLKKAPRQVMQLLDGELKAPSMVLIFGQALETDEDEELVAFFRKRNIPVSVQLRPRLSDFSLPTYLKRGHLKIAVHSDQVLPGFEKVLLSRLEASLQSQLDRMSIFIGQLEELLETHLSGKESMRSRLVESLQNAETFLGALSRSSYDEALRLAQEHCTKFFGVQSFIEQDQVLDQELVEGR